VGAALVLRVAPRLDVFPDLATASEALADVLIQRARESVAARGRFRWVISGGHTPLPLFELLGGPRGRRIPWAQTEVFFADERCVPPRSPSSNYRLARTTFLGRVPIPRASVHRIRGEVRPPFRAASEYARLMGPLPSSRSLDAARFDAVLLGIGPDGHTASLFPHAPALRERRRPVVAVRRAGQPPYIPRITMTLAALGSSREIHFLVSGRDKAEALRAIFRASARGSANWPASQVRSRGVVRWFVDRDAASAIPAAIRPVRRR
jgi:6-phosphogluconolactonase